MQRMLKLSKMGLATLGVLDLVFDLQMDTKIWVVYGLGSNSIVSHATLIP